jgi:hypothetical protein
VDGCLEEEPSATDFTAVPNLSSLPPRADLRPNCSPVEDQGRIGSCVACAVVGAMEYQERRTGRSSVDLSRMFVYFNARRMRGSEHLDTGTTIASGLAAFLAFGAPPESAWPYDPALVTKAPDDHAFLKARAYVPAEYARVSGIDHVKGALFRQFPVIFSASLPMRCYEEAGRTGIMPKPSSSELAAIRTEHGRHAMLLVGYDLDKGVFHVRNSWGRGWGETGHCAIDIETFQAAMAENTTWILGSLDTAGDFTITRPSRPAAAATAAPVSGSVRDLAAKMREELRSGLVKDIDSAIKDVRQRVNPPRQGGQ